jgi:hypothetical protein
VPRCVGPERRPAGHRRPRFSSVRRQSARRHRPNVGAAPHLCEQGSRTEQA